MSEAERLVSLVHQMEREIAALKRYIDYILDPTGEIRRAATARAAAEQREWEARKREKEAQWKATGLSARTRHALQRTDISPDAIRQMTDEELGCVRNVGRTTIAELRGTLGGPK